MFDTQEQTIKGADRAWSLMEVAPNDKGRSWMALLWRIWRRIAVLGYSIF
jgi:hypothetical protein